MKRFSVAVVIAFCVSAAAAAEASLGNAIVRFDPQVWKLTELSGRAALMFNCVAADCPGNPAVFAVTTAVAEDGGPIQFFGPEEFLDSVALDLVPTPDGIAFSAWSHWSGCRARDAAVLTASADHEGSAYHFSTADGGTCNFNPELPEARFAELLAGVRPTE